MDNVTHVWAYRNRHCPDLSRKIIIIEELRHKLTMSHSRWPFVHLWIGQNTSGNLNMVKISTIFQALDRPRCTSNSNNINTCSSLNHFRDVAKLKHCSESHQIANVQQVKAANARILIGVNGDCWLPSVNNVSFYHSHRTFRIFSAVAAESEWQPSECSRCIRNGCETANECVFYICVARIKCARAKLELMDFIDICGERDAIKAASYFKRRKKTHTQKPKTARARVFVCEREWRKTHCFT